MAATRINQARFARKVCRTGEHVGPTAVLAAGYVQANLVVVPESVAADFLLFASKNPKPCPVIEVVKKGSEAIQSAPGSDIRSDLPGYRLYRDGVFVESASNAREWWREDLVSVLLGCSFSFEAAMLRNGLPVRHLELNKNVPMFITNRQCQPAGSFSAPLVVTFRPMPAEHVDEAAEITGNYPHAHGGPIHIGDPAELGISNLMEPDFGDAVPLRDGEVPMFWACGVTSQLAVSAAAPEIAITHEPGHMFITDLSDVESGVARG